VNTEEAEKARLLRFARSDSKRAPRGDLGVSPNAVKTETALQAEIRVRRDSFGVKKDHFGNDAASRKRSGEENEA